MDTMTKLKGFLKSRSEYVENILSRYGVVTGGEVSFRDVCMIAILISNTYPVAKKEIAKICPGVVISGSKKSVLESVSSIKGFFPSLIYESSIFSSENRKAEIYALRIGAPFELVCQLNVSSDELASIKARRKNAKSALKVRKSEKAQGLLEFAPESNKQQFYKMVGECVGLTFSEIKALANGKDMHSYYQYKPKVAEKRRLKAEVVERRLSGESAVSIAKALGISRVTVRNYVREYEQKGGSVSEEMESERSEEGK